MNESVNSIQGLELIDDPSLEAVLAEVRPAGELTTEERLERRRRQGRDAMFNRVLSLLNGAGYSVTQFAEWAGGKKEEPSTSERMREIRMERDNNAREKSDKPAEGAEPRAEEQGNGRTTPKTGRKATVIATRKTETPIKP